MAILRYQVRVEQGQTALAYSGREERNLCDVVPFPPKPLQSEASRRHLLMLCTQPKSHQPLLPSPSE